ncbi:hypothetical protein [Bradyrhizobium diazoefficiens]
MFKGASQNSQRRVGRSGKSEHAAKLCKLDMIGDAKPSKAMLGRLKNMEQGLIAREAKLKLKAELQRQALDPKFADERREKITKKLTKRMRNVVVEVKKKAR